MPDFRNNYLKSDFLFLHGWELCKNIFKIKSIMKQINYILFCVMLSSVFSAYLKGQETIPASGNNASGTNGSISYSVGQIFYITIVGTNGSITQGVQQPYEILIITAVKNARKISLESMVYPNPTSAKVNLVVKTKGFINLRYQLYDLNGNQIMTNIIENEETEIIMDNLLPSTYFLKILRNNQEIKTFKIIKY